MGGVGGQVDSAFYSRLKDTCYIPAEAGHCVTTLGKLFTPTVPSGAEARLNQLTPAIADTSVCYCICITFITFFFFW